MSEAEAAIAALRAEHDTLAAVVQRLTADDLARPSGAPGWDVSRVLGHLGSGAQIATALTRAALDADATASHSDINQAVKDRWNAWSRQERADAFLRESASLLALYEALDIHARDNLTIDLGVPPEPLDLPSAARWHLREFALHSWDVRVAFDPHATLSSQTAAVLLDDTPDLLAWSGKTDRLRPQGSPLLIEVTTSEPAATFTLHLQEPITVDFAPSAQPDGTLTLPAEAWLRLLAGRLDAEHTPASVTTTGAADLDRLRSVFPNHGECEPEEADAPASQNPHTDADAEPERPASSRRAGRRIRKWLRRLGIAALAVFAAVTAFSLIFNAATQPPADIDPGFGAYVQVGSSSVHYQTWGASGTPIVMIPGFLESSTVWSEVGPLLGEHHVVYALDLPGDGYTRYTGPMLLNSAAELVDGFIQALHLQRPLLVGHSLGAAVAGSLALAHPQDVRKVIFADGDGLTISLPPKWLRSLILDGPYMTTLLRIGSRWTSVDKWLIKTTCGPSCPALSTALAEEWTRPLHQLSGEHALHDLMVNSDYGLTPQQISAITVPTAIIWGSDDSQGGSLDGAIADLHHPPVHTIGNAGHLTMIADPKAFVQAVESESS